MPHLILRLVPAGAKAEGYDADEALDLAAPCDLVALFETDGEERESERRSFTSGKDAHRYLCQLMRGERGKEAKR